MYYNYFNLIIFLIYIYLFCRGVVYHSAHVEITEQLAEVSSRLLLCGPRTWTQEGLGQLLLPITTLPTSFSYLSQWNFSSKYFLFKIGSKEKKKKKSIKMSEKS